MENTTINYYNQNAKKYSDSTFNLDVSEATRLFALSLEPKAKILDVGCGSGRDSKFFMSKGFDVVSIDASEELAAVASKNLQKEVLVVDLKDLKIKDTFDAIWCQASLLHLYKDELPLAIKNCVQALKVDKAGLLFASFKKGDGCGADENGRYFSYYSVEELQNIFEKTECFQFLGISITKDILGRENTEWINIVAKKKPELILEHISKNKRYKF